jgi:hypothetical protein
MPEVSSGTGQQEEFRQEDFPGVKISLARSPVLKDGAKGTSGQGIQLGGGENSTCNDCAGVRTGATANR